MNDSNSESASVFRISFKYRFEAAHRFTKSCADSCATPHGHTWYAKAVFEARDRNLADDDMVLEFSLLKKAWKNFLQETVDHSFMHHFEDPILSALKMHIPKFRGLPFPGDPTTELIAALFFAKLQVMHKQVDPTGILRPVSVVIRETPTNTVSFKIDRGGSSALIQRLDSKYRAWWQSADPEARELEKISK